LSIGFIFAYVLELCFYVFIFKNLFILEQSEEQRERETSRLPTDWGAQAESPRLRRPHPRT